MVTFRSKKETHFTFYGEEKGKKNVILVLQDSSLQINRAYTILDNVLLFYLDNYHIFFFTIKV